MKCQIEGQSLRVRIDERELACLLDGEVLHGVSHFAGAFSIDVAIQSIEVDDPALTGEAATWRVTLPSNDLGQLAARLPSRDGLTYRLQGPTAADTLTLLFDVDVRDSARRRRQLKT